MESISIQQLMEAVGAQRLDQGGEITFSSVSTDSRKMEAGSLFIPLVGERFDGHDYIDKASPAARRERCALFGRSACCRERHICWWRTPAWP